MRGALTRARAWTRAAALAGLLAGAGAAAAAPTGPGSAPASPSAGRDSLRAAVERAGHVSYVRYDPAKAGTTGGVTHFFLTYAYTYTYRYQWQDRDGRRWLSVTPRVRAEVAVRHTIDLPRASSDTVAWIRRLADHELDHVAISLDERAVLLLQHLVSGLGAVWRSLPPGATITDSVVHRAVDEEVARRKEEVTAFIQANYARLDSLTGHGSSPLADRRAFFEDLYSRGNLEVLRFPRLAEVAGLLDQPAYREARRYWLP